MGTGASGYLMTPSNAHDPTEAKSSELGGLDILLIEDSWHIGSAMKNLGPSTPGRSHRRRQSAPRLTGR
jgi:hypothetical protein